MSLEKDLHPKPYVQSRLVNGYDLDAFGDHFEKQELDHRAQKVLAEDEVERRIRKVKSLYGHINPYDIEQLDYILEPTNPPED